MRFKFIIIAIATLFCTSLYSQKKEFARGYYIDAKSNRIECLIKDEDWDFNPTEFITRTDETSPSKVIPANDFMEFGVNEYKFVKTKVKIDKSNDRYDRLSGDKMLNLEEETLVLRALMEGEANLYSYKNEKFTRFFYSQNNGVITQLSFKMYLQDGGVGKNNAYKQELLNSLKCDKITQNDIEDLDYDNNKLYEFFKKYNLCKATGMTDFRAKKVINTFELYVKVGLGISNLNYYNGSSHTDFDTKTKFRPAIEAEINLSNKRKIYSMLIELSYQHYKSTDNRIVATNVDYKSIDISGGIRKYFLLTPKAMLFINGYVTYGLSINSKLSSYGINKTISPSIGLGCLYNKKYTLDVRYEFNRDLLRDYVLLSTEYNTLLVNFGYKLL